jgi:hypothetical protein
LASAAFRQYPVKIAVCLFITKTEDLLTESSHRLALGLREPEYERTGRLVR